MDADDVYAELLRCRSENWVARLLAFAVFEQRRIEWRQHYQHVTGHLPNSAEISVWYASQPPTAVASAVTVAESALDAFGQSTIEAFKERNRRQTEGHIISEVQKLGRWWPQFGFNVLGGVVGSLVYTVLLILMDFLILNEPSANDLSNHLMQKMEKQDEPIEVGP